MALCKKSKMIYQSSQLSVAKLLSTATPPGDPTCSLLLSSSLSARDCRSTGWRGGGMAAL